jgi:hypothetical protein
MPICSATRAHSLVEQFSTMFAAFVIQMPLWLLARYSLIRPLMSTLAAGQIDSLALVTTLHIVLLLRQVFPLFVD